MSPKKYAAAYPLIIFKFITITFNDGSKKDIFFERQDNALINNVMTPCIISGKGEPYSIASVKKIEFTK